MSTDQDHPSDGQPPKTPQPKRTSIGTDPTMPISLRRPVPDPAAGSEPDVVAPMIPEVPPAPEDWAGSEQTLVGAAPSDSSDSDRQPVVVVEAQGAAAGNKLTDATPDVPEATAQLTKGDEKVAAKCAHLVQTAAGDGTDGEQEADCQLGEALQLLRQRTAHKS